MKKFVRFVEIFLGSVLIIGGCYKIYKALGGNQQKAEPVAMNEVATDKNGVEFTALSVEDEDDYILVNVNITNNSTEPYDVNSLNFVLTDGTSDYECSTDLSFLDKENAMFIDTLNPGLSQDYILGYETSVKSTDKDWQLKIDNNIYINLS